MSKAAQLSTYVVLRGICLCAGVVYVLLILNAGRMLLGRLDHLF